MFPSTLFGLRKFRSCSARTARPRSLEARFRPQLEALESRLAPANIVTVNTIADEFDSGPNNLAGPDSVLSLREALEASTVDKIIFDSTVFATAQTITLDTNLGQIFRYNTSLSIVGPTVGVTIDGHNQVLGRAPLGNGWFALYPSNNNGWTTSISNVNFINLVSDNEDINGSGGAIDFTGGNTLNLSNCTFSGNSAPDGGAIFDEGATINITNCTFTNNSASGIFSPRGGFGGAIYDEGGGAVTINKNSNLSNNTAVGGGGAVYIDPSTLTIDSSTITGNSAPLGADVYNQSSSVAVVNSTVGGIYNNAGTVTVVNSAVSSISNNGGTVITPDSAATNLTAQISALSQAGTLTADQAAGLNSKLQAAQQSLDSGNITPGANQLNAIINQLNAFVKSHTLTSTQAQPLIDGANQLITAVSAAGARLVNDTGNSATTDTQPVTDDGQLVSGALGVYLDNADGTPVSADEQA